MQLQTRQRDCFIATGKLPVVIQATEQDISLITLIALIPILCLDSLVYEDWSGNSRMSTENRIENSLNDSEPPEEKGNHVAIQMNGTNGHASGKVAHKKHFNFLRKSSKKGDGKSAQVSQQLTPTWSLSHFSFCLFPQSDLDLAKEVHITEHLLTFAQLEGKFETSLENGLSSVEAQFRLARDGPNAFTPPKQTPNWLILFRELTGGFAWIMWFSAIASLVAFFVDNQNKDDVRLGEEAEWVQLTM